MMDIVDRIVNSNLPKQVKIIRLWALTQLYYRGSVGDKAWDGIRRLTDAPTAEAIAFLTGFCSTGVTRDSVLKLLGKE